MFKTSALFFVGLPGLEPGKAGPESAVLPLHHSPIISGAKVVQVHRTTKQNEKFFHIIFTLPTELIQNQPVATNKKRVQRNPYTLSFIKISLMPCEYSQQATHQFPWFHT